MVYVYGQKQQIKYNDTTGLKHRSTKLHSHLQSNIADDNDAEGKVLFKQNVPRKLRVFPENFVMTNLRTVKSYSINNRSRYGVGKCGISFKAYFQTTDNSQINRTIQFKSVYADPEKPKGQWHLGSIYAYAIDQALGLNVTPETFLLLYKVNSHIVTYRHQGDIIKQFTSCVPKAEGDYFTATATTWELHIKKRSWPDIKLSNAAQYILLLYLADCRKSHMSHYFSQSMLTYRSIDTDHCMLDFVKPVPYVDKLMQSHTIFNTSVLCGLPDRIITQLIQLNDSNDRSKLSDYVNYVLKVYNKKYKINRGHHEKLLTGIDARASMVVERWKRDCELE